MKRKLFPLWLVIVADILLLAIGLCTFAYFHHIRILWAPFDLHEPTALEIYQKPNKNSNEKVLDIKNPDDNTPLTHGDFGERFGSFFTNSVTKVNNLTKDAEIRGFLELHGFTVSDNLNSKYIGLYQSKDVFITVEKINDLGYVVSADETMMETIYIYDIYIRNIENFYTSAYETRTSLSNLIKNVGYLTNANGISFAAGLPIAAINGDYWGNTNQTLTAVRNGKLYLETDELQTDILVLYYDGAMEVYTKDTYDKEAINQRGPYQIWNFGPGLLDDQGYAIKQFSSDFYDNNVITTAHPRTGIGYYEPGHYCFVTVEGRKAKAQGFRMVHLASFFEKLGCSVAYNMDGGGSSQSYFNGKILYNGDGRHLFDIICIGEVKSTANTRRTSGGNAS
ncbi:MAG: hypothetical protein E7616_03645 [Ruminococcaceae bacterium]|nr:hypothetical protein [Oscillospiraceae bacterium]